MNLNLTDLLLEETDSIEQDRIRMQIGKAPLTKWGKKYIADNPQVNQRPKNRNYPIKTNYSVFLDYYTLYPNHEGKLEEHPDNYHYDPIIENALDRF